MNISKIYIFVRMFDRIVDDCIFFFVLRIKEICLLSISLNIIIIVKRFDWIWWFDKFLKFWLNIVLNIFDQSLKNLSRLLRELNILSIVIHVRHIWIECENKFDTFCVSWNDIQRDYDVVSSSKKNDDDVIWDFSFNWSKKCSKNLNRKIFAIDEFRFEMIDIKSTIIQSKNCWLFR